MQQSDRWSGVQKIPFTREIAVGELLPMPHLDEHRDALLEQLERRMSAAVIAPAGAGKSCLLRSLRAHLSEARYRVLERSGGRWALAASAAAPAQLTP